MTTTETQVGIIGAGPAGLVLAHLLERAGISCVVLEAQSRAYVESRVRAGVLEHGTVELLDQLGLSERLHREGLVHEGVYLQFEGVRHRIDFSALVGRTITVYGQQELVKDLIASRLSAGGELCFGAQAVSIGGLEETADAAVISYRDDQGEHELRCEFVAGCDGFHGVARQVIPEDVLRLYEKEYPYAWLGILADVAPSTDELIYSYTDRGFALHSLRSPTTSRLYLQVRPDDDIARWSDELIWSELRARLEIPGWTLHDGPIIEKAITPMRSFVAEPMAWGRLFLAGDAAHIVPPTGAKGLNLAVADVVVFANALSHWYRERDRSRLDRYTEDCLGRVWRVQDFSTTMTYLMHRNEDGDGFDLGVQRARQRYIWQSSAMSTSLAENYVGLPLPSID